MEPLEPNQPQQETPNKGYLGVASLSGCTKEMFDNISGDISYFLPIIPHMKVGQNFVCCEEVCLEDFSIEKNNPSPEAFSRGDSAAFLINVYEQRRPLFPIEVWRLRNLVKVVWGLPTELQEKNHLWFKSSWGYDENKH